MKFMLLILALAVILWLIPYIRIFFKRLSLCRRLHAACKANGWTLSPTHRFWYFGSKNDARCDVHVATKHDVFSVKLFAVPHRCSTLVFTGGNAYFIRRYLGLIGNNGTSATIPLDGKERFMPAYRFRAGFSDDWETKHQHKILLLSPTPFEIQRKLHEGKEQLLGTGDLVLDMHVYSLSRLLGRMKQLDEHLHGVSAFENLSNI